MRNAIIFSIMLLTSFCNAQEGNYRGIGELKVGETSISLIDSIAAKSKKKIKKVAAFASSDDANYNKFIVEYVKPTNKCSDATNPIIPEHRVFVVYNYSVMDMYPASKIFLDFYNDVLYHFVVFEPQFVPEFKSKYGAPVTDEIYHDGKCDHDGISEVVNDKDIIESWDDKNIHVAHMIISTRANVDCAKVVNTKFEVTEMEVNKTVQVLEHNALKLCQEAETAEKKPVVPDGF